MQDIYLEWAADLAVGSNGDLALVEGPNQTNQRVLRRLLTNPADYLWNLDYGGGLGLFVGSVASPADIEAVIRTQLSLEAAIPESPSAAIVVQTLDTTQGYFTAQITYSDPFSGNLVNLNVLAG